MFPDENFIPTHSDWIQDIELVDLEFGGVRGICLPETRRTCIYLARHEAEEDVMATMEHENIHQVCSDEELETMDFWDIKHEHRIIKDIMWCKQNFDENTHYSVIRGEHVKPKISEQQYEKLMKKYNKMSDKLDECNTFEDE